jgi:hypothetical protein
MGSTTGPPEMPMKPGTRLMTVAQKAQAVSQDGGD